MDSKIFFFYSEKNTKVSFLIKILFVKSKEKGNKNNIFLKYISKNY